MPIERRKKQYCVHLDGTIALEYTHDPNHVCFCTQELRKAKHAAQMIAQLRKVNLQKEGLNRLARFQEVL